MDRYKQFECLEGTFTWYDEIMSKYEAALWVHYRMLCKMIDIWIDEVKRNEEPPRVMCFIHTEYMSMVLSELLLTVEILLKAELVRAGCPEHELKNHTLLYLLDKLASFDSDRCVSISKLFDSCRCFFDMMDKNNTFVNVRYIDYDKVILDSDVVFDIRDTVSVLDAIYDEYYSDFDIKRLLYLGMILEEADLSEDDRRRLRKLCLIKE